MHRVATTARSLPRLAHALINRSRVTVQTVQEGRAVNQPTSPERIAMTRRLHRPGRTALALMSLLLPLTAFAGGLQGPGFTIDETAAGRGTINFSGNVGHVESPFHTQTPEYVANGKHPSATSDAPSPPRAIANLAHGVVTLNSFGRKPMNTGG